MSYVVEKDIPIPAKRNGNRTPSSRAKQYPFGELAIGDSFFVVVDAVEMYRKRQTLISSARKWAQKRDDVPGGRKFTVRVVDGGLRIWRTA